METSEMRGTMPRDERKHSRWGRSISKGPGAWACLKNREETRVAEASE